MYVDPRDSFHTLCCWMRKMRVQRTSEHDLGPPTEFSVPSPIQYGRLNYITCEPEFEPYMQQGCCKQRLFDTLANHRTHNMRPHCHFDWRMGIGCATVGMDQWETYFSYVEISALLTYWHGEFARKQISFRKRLRLVPGPVKVLIMDVWL